GQDTINVVMAVDYALLDEILLIGYGNQSKRFITDNIVKVTARDIAEIPTPNVFTTLAGKVAGVQVNQTNGKIESGLNFRIRGRSSLSAGTDPLFVLDGIPLINLDESTEGQSNPLITLSPSEIESIDILKDASAAAIYGSRGSNGVVLITTKKGQYGESKFSINFSNGISEPTNTLDWLNAEQYVELLLESAQRSSFGDLTGFVENTFDRISNDTWRDGTYDTDWQDIALRDGYIRDMDFSMSGGSEKTRFFFSGAYNDTKGIVDGNNLNRISTRINVDHDFSTKLSAGMNLGYSRTNIDRVARDASFVNPLQAIAQAPISPPIVDREPFDNTFYPNYLLEDKYAFFNSKLRRLSGKLFGIYKFADWLQWQTNFSYEYYGQKENYFGGPLSPLNTATNGYSYVNNAETENYVISSYLTFDKTFNDIHNFNVVLGTEFNRAERIFDNIEGIEFPSSDFTNIGSAANIIGGGGGASRFSFLSYFFRTTYSLHDKYLFKASIRRDGSSRFGKNNAYGTFPALSVGWIVTQEEFLNDSNWLSFLKLRASWGETGNAQIPDFASLTMFADASYNQRPGIMLVSAGNDDLTWETTQQTDVGFEFGLLDNKIKGELAYYSKKTVDLLFNRPLPLTSGNPNGNDLYENIGKMSNKGFELTLSLQNIQTDTFSWTTNFNMSNNEGEITDLANGQDQVFFDLIYREGEAPASYYLREYAGVDPDNGDALYYLNTENEDGSINRNTTNEFNEAKRIITGQPLPNWLAGITNTIIYKDFSTTWRT
ncbi:MAG: SusC/RagA family TonB-linked outer membrane protein, partial [Flavobacteriaceae bacterium]|nr:SusC/RagA family TonB-linked outer membrane protein [Flavobacteriaceae bacterium]